MAAPTHSQLRAILRAALVARGRSAVHPGWSPGRAPGWDPGVAGARLALVALLSGMLAVAGCGDNHGDPERDAAAEDAAEVQDAPPSDLVADPMACTREYKRCEHEDPGFCREMGLDCVQVRVDTQASVCLRRCDDTADCPFNSYCVPTKVEWGGLSLAAKHCIGSVCGKTYGNGELFGACSVGGDNLVSLDAGQQRPGTCLPIDTDAGTGACLESGNETTGTTAERDQSCSLDREVLGCPFRPDVVACVAGTTCIGQLCEGYGSCALLCDPRLDPEGQCTVGAGKPKQFCQDISLLTLGASGKLHTGYVGVCQSNPLCRLFAERLDGGAPAAGCGPADECYPSTMVTTNGVCSQHGAPAVGEECQFLNDCASGSICVGDDPCGKGVCRRLCPLPDDGLTCGTGLSCHGVALDTSQPTVKSMPWGVCEPQSTARSATRPRVMVRPLAARRR
jgi:hypothetical protein